MQYALLQDFNTLFIIKYINTYIYHFQQLTTSTYWFLPTRHSRPITHSQICRCKDKNLFFFLQIFFEKITTFLTNVSKSLTNGQKKGKKGKGGNCFIRFFVPSCFGLCFCIMFLCNRNSALQFLAQ